MVMNRRGQFFLLAAVIISVVVISLGATANRVSVKKESRDFYDFSYDVKREAGEVLNYEIYSDIEGGTLDAFVRLLAADIRDKEPDANFMFIYGNNVEMNLRNYGASEAFTGGELIPGAGTSVISTICFGKYCQDVNETISDFNDGAGYVRLDEEDMAGSDEISVTVEGSDFSFPISEQRQVVFIIQKEVGDESFVAVK